jgi:hypothetical protein
MKLLSPPPFQGIRNLPVPTSAFQHFLVWSISCIPLGAQQNQMICNHTLSASSFPIRNGSINLGPQEWVSMIWGSHSGDYEGCGFLGCNATCFSSFLAWLTLWTLKMDVVCSSETSSCLQSMWCYNPDDHILQYVSVSRSLRFPYLLYPVHSRLSGGNRGK